MCARLQTICAKPSELGDYSGRMRGFIARRFKMVEFGRVSVRNSPFEFFPRNLHSVSPNSHGWILRALWFTFPRVKSSNVIPGHALHEKGLQKPKGDCPLVSCQEQRPLLVPLVHRVRANVAQPEKHHSNKTRVKTDLFIMQTCRI